MIFYLLFFLGAYILPLAISVVVGIAVFFDAKLKISAKILMGIGFIVPPLGLIYEGGNNVSVYAAMYFKLVCICLAPVFVGVAIMWRQGLGSFSKKRTVSIFIGLCCLIATAWHIAYDKEDVAAALNLTHNLVEHFSLSKTR